MSYANKIKLLGRHEYDTKSRSYHAGAHKNWPGGNGFNPNNPEHRRLLLIDMRAFQRSENFNADF